MKVNKIYQMDCLKGMQEMDNNSIDLVIVDPPYFNIMKSDWKGNKYIWDKWESFDEYLDFIRKLAKEINRVIKDNGSLYFFCDDKILSYIQVELDKFGWILLNHIIWWKRNNMSIKGWSGFRSYATVTERILFYSVQGSKTGLQEIYEDKNCFKEIKEYMRNERQKIIKHNRFKTQEEFNEYINEVSNTSSVVSRHYFPDSQWVFPTKGIYNKLQTTGFFKRGYEELRKEYEELRMEYEELRRTFNITKNYTDVWDIPIMGGNETVNHPTQKPLKLIERIIRVSSNEGDLILDPFMGSGSVAIECKKLNRNFICFEINSDDVSLSKDRLNATYIKPSIRGML